MPRKKKEIRIIVHKPNDLSCVSDRVSKVYTEIIVRRLKHTDMIADEKVMVIDRIINSKSNSASEPAK